jgi:hypothetical protein
MTGSPMANTWATAVERIDRTTIRMIIRWAAKPKAARTADLAAAPREH